MSSLPAHRRALTVSLVLALVAVPMPASPALAEGQALGDPRTILEDHGLDEASPGVLANDRTTSSDLFVYLCVVSMEATSDKGGSVFWTSDGGFSFYPPPNVNGLAQWRYDMADYFSGYPCPASESYAFVMVTITPVNDPPTIGQGLGCLSPVVVSEDSGAYVGTYKCAYYISNGPSNEATPVQDFKEWIVASTNPALFSVGPHFEFDGFDYQLAFTPAANAYGSATVTVKARDTGGTDNGGIDLSEPVTVSVEIGAVNDAPTAANDAYSVQTGHTLNVGAPGLLSNDSDVDGNSISAQQVSSPAHGTLVLAANGSFSYTPAAGYVGPDAFTYRAFDGSLPSATRTVSLTVQSSPTPVPTASPSPGPSASSPPAGSSTPSPAVSAGGSPVGSASPGNSPSADPSADASSSAEPGSSGSSDASGSPPPSGAPGPAGGANGFPWWLIVAAAIVGGGTGAAMWAIRRRRIGTQPPGG